MKEHEIFISTHPKPEQLTAPKFWSIGYVDEQDRSGQLVGKSVYFRGGEWRVNMACQQLSLDNHVAGVKKHPEPKEVELIATVWGAQRVRVWREDGEHVNEMCGPLTRDEANEATYIFLEAPDGDPLLRIVHKTRGSFDVPFSITMPTESHQTAYSRDAGCIAIKMAQITTAQVQ